MSNSADITAVAGLWKRLLKPAPTASVTRLTEPARARMTWLCDLASVQNVVKLIVPGSQTTVSILGASVKRYIPLQHPDFTNLYAVGYEVEYQHGEYSDGTTSVGSSSNGTEDLCRVTVNFETPQYPFNGDAQFLNVSIGGYTQEVPLDGVALASGTPGYDMVHIVPGAEYSVTVYDAPGIDEAVEQYWIANAGSVNASPFRGVPAGMVLYKHPTLQYTFKQDGTRVCQYTLHFNASAIPWNQTRNRSGALEAFTVNSAPLYPSLDFSKLWY